MSETGIREGIAMMHAGLAKVAATGLDCLILPDLLAVADELETLTCQLPTQRHRILARLQAEATPKELGAKSWNDVLRIRFRISSAEAHRRLTHAALLGPRQTLTGQPLEPVLACTAAAQAAGTINPEHVEVIRKAINKLPGFVDTATREQVETDLAGRATGIGPKQLTLAAVGTDVFTRTREPRNPQQRETTDAVGLRAVRPGP